MNILQWKIGDRNFFPPKVDDWLLLDNGQYHSPKEIVIVGFPKVPMSKVRTLVTSPLSHQTLFVAIPGGCTSPTPPPPHIHSDIVWGLPLAAQNTVFISPDPKLIFDTFQTFAALQPSKSKRIYTIYTIFIYTGSLRCQWRKLQKTPYGSRRKNIYCWATESNHLNQCGQIVFSFSFQFKYR